MTTQIRGDLAQALWATLLLNSNKGRLPHGDMKRIADKFGLGRNVVARIWKKGQLFDDSDGREGDVNDVDSNSNRGDYALLSMPVESVKRVVSTTGVVTRPRSTDTSLRHGGGSSIQSLQFPADNRRSHQGSQVCVRENDSCDAQRDIPESSSHDGADPEVRR
ncbi:hypothetical protein PR003_g30056 [Phytophthora rubi]|uniref:DUF7769 domain-containing protein n=1 Tax=Phytophthora rubi TaxID=129364 RepID=A0A6A4BD17_9STRA|nr:hypothetical protein PR003_g30056 [Phytophthora rubi]